MFDNILGLDTVVASLKQELDAGALPAAMLFHGAPYGGKLSTALEVARVITCREGTGSWECGCASCTSQRELAHPYTILIGSRYFDLEVPACADVLLRTRTKAGLYLFIRSVRKLTRRFDPMLWEGEEARIRAIVDGVNELEEGLLELSPGRELARTSVLEPLVQKLARLAVKVASQIKNDHISVNQLRKASSWAHLASPDSGKIIIIENVDRMQDSARNSMLKILEEPPEGVHFILTTCRKAAVAPTVASRLRSYAFPARNREAEQDVLARIFRETPPRYATLRQYFLAWKELNPETVSKLAGDFLREALRPGSHSVDVLGLVGELLAAKNPKEAVSSFLEELVRRLHRALADSEVDMDRLERWDRDVHEAAASLDLYNVSPSLVVESLLYRMRSVR